MQVITDERRFNDFVHDTPAAAIWFSGADCHVCHLLLPRVEALLAEEFPRVRLGMVDCGEAQELAATQGVFSIPTLLLYFDGHETQRFVRNFSPAQVREALLRPYQLLFE